jgi:hypothetical protein
MEKNPIFFILCAKNTFKKYGNFSGFFLVTAITAATDYFLADYFHILKVLSIYYYLPFTTRQGAMSISLLKRSLI